MVFSRCLEVKTCPVDQMKLDTTMPSTSFFQANQPDLADVQVLIPVDQEDELRA
jgi:hypothetical protein